jgi:hypothetical protein
MDDRRFRLKNVEKGDVAIFDYLQHQLHFNKDGVFLTGRTDKKIKFQLFDPPQQQQQSGGSGGAKVAATAASGSSGGDSSSSSSSSSYGQTKRYDQQGKQYVEMTKDTTNLVHDQSINHKAPLHSFQPSSSASARSGNPLVQIFGDKFTGGLGYFMKQVTAAPPISAMHVATKGYVDSIFAALGVNIPPLPPLPIPPLPPGVTLPPGIPGITSFEASVMETETANETMPNPLEARLLALESRIAELESRLRGDSY